MKRFFVANFILLAVLIVSLSFSGCEKIELVDEFTPETENVEDRSSNVDVSDLNLDQEKINSYISDVHIFSKLVSLSKISDRLLVVTYDTKWHFTFVNSTDTEYSNLMSKFQSKDIVDRITTADYDELTIWMKRQVEAGNTVVVFYDNDTRTYTGIAYNEE